MLGKALSRITGLIAPAGERIARDLVERKLAACVQVVPGLTSFYVWEGKLERRAAHVPGEKRGAACRRHSSEHICAGTMLDVDRLPLQRC
jgi:uncharacterized protein involved in tolerance to divalent cations